MNSPTSSRTCARWSWAAELESTEDTVYPVQLAELLPAIAADRDGETRPVR